MSLLSFVETGLEKIWRVKNASSVANQIFVRRPFRRFKKCLTKSVMPLRKRKGRTRSKTLLLKGDLKRSSTLATYFVKDLRESGCRTRRYLSRVKPSLRVADLNLSPKSTRKKH
jgi:hypothetical protein